MSLAGVLTKTALGGGGAPSSLRALLFLGDWPWGWAPVSSTTQAQHLKGGACPCLAVGMPRHSADCECSGLPQSAQSLGTEVDTDRNPRDLVAGAAPAGCPGVGLPSAGQRGHWWKPGSRNHVVSWQQACNEVGSEATGGQSLHPSALGQPLSSPCPPLASCWCLAVCPSASVCAGPAAGPVQQQGPTAGAGTTGACR